MTFLWLIVWLLKDTPSVDFSGEWNNWAIALVVCAVIDLVGTRRIL